MKELQIERNIDNKKITVTLTDDELEKAYRIMNGTSANSSIWKPERRQPDEKS